MVDTSSPIQAHRHLHEPDIKPATESTQQTRLPANHSTGDGSSSHAEAASPRFDGVPQVQHDGLMHGQLSPDMHGKRSSVGREIATGSGQTSPRALQGTPTPARSVGRSEFGSCCPASAPLRVQTAAGAAIAAEGFSSSMLSIVDTVSRHCDCKWPLPRHMLPLLHFCQVETYSCHLYQHGQR